MRLGFASFWLDQRIKEHFTRPAANPLFISAAKTYGARVAGIVLSGVNNHGAAGILAITARSGLGLLQNLDEAKFSDMPMAALNLDHPEAPITAGRLAERLVAHCASF